MSMGHVVDGRGRAATNVAAISPAAQSAGHARRRLRPADRRVELLEAAIRTLRRGEPEANWVAAVTREAGAAKGTFYVYFPSWEHMLAAVRQQLTWSASEPLAGALASPTSADWWAVLEQECCRFVDTALEFRAQHGLIFHSDLPAEIEAALPSGPDLLRAAIERGIEQGAFRPVDGEVAANLLFAAVHAAADAVLDGGDRSRWVGACLELSRAWLGRTPRTAARE